MKIHKDDDYLLKIGELRQLLYWATEGVSQMRGGTYDKTIISTLRKLAKDIHFNLRDQKARPLRFGRDIL